MKSIQLSGSPRENVGKSESNQLRAEGKIPCVLYGNAASQIHFWAHAYDLKSVLFTPETYKVMLTLDGKTHTCVVQEAQYHPLNGAMLHVDFMLLDPNKPVRLNLPLEFIGTSPGVRAGGKFVSRMRSITVKGLSEQLPSSVKVDISNLELGGVVRVRDIQTEGFTLVAAPANPVAAVTIPRAMKGAAAEGGK
jgi:large subunit ribosomal protein L25